MRVKHLEGKGCTGLTEMALCKKLKIHQTKWAEKDALIEKVLTEFSQLKPLIFFHSLFENDF